MKTLAEKRALKKLGIPDWRHLTKDMVVPLVSVLPRLDPEVAKAALNQIPEFTGMAKEIIPCLREMATNGFKQADEAQKALFDSCNRVLDTLDRELQSEHITSEDKQRIEGEMLEVLGMLQQNVSSWRSFLEGVGKVFSYLASGALIAGIGFLSYKQYNSGQGQNYIEGEFDEVA